MNIEHINYKLWKFFKDEHDLILTDGELQDIIIQVKRYDRAINNPIFDWNLCNRIYKTMGLYGTNQNICLNLTERKTCKFFPHNCDAKTY
jgi:hypothetical protein